MKEKILHCFRLRHCVAGTIVSSAPQAVGSFSPLEDFDALVYNLSLTLYQQMLLKIDGKESMRAKGGFRIFHTERLNKYMDGLSNTAFSWTIS